LNKYSEEPWSEYLKRLRDASQKNKIREEEIFIKLRKENSPEILLNFLCLWSKYGNSYRKIDKTSKLSKIECYTCRNEGHYSDKCPNKNSEINNLNKNFTGSLSDVEEITLNRVKYLAVSDDSSAVSTFGISITFSRIEEKSDTDGKKYQVKTKHQKMTKNI
jgi:hypothetical protein